MAGKLDDIASALKAAYPPDWISNAVGGKPFWEMTEPTPMKVAQDITSLMLFSIPDPAEREKAATAMIPLLLRLVRMAEVVEEAEDEEEDIQISYTPPLKGNVYGSSVVKPAFSAQDLINQARAIAQRGGNKPAQILMNEQQLAEYQKIISHVYAPDGQQPVKAVMGGMPVVLDSQVPPGEVYVVREDGMRERVMRVRAEELEKEPRT